MALELKCASDATVLLTDLVDSLGRPSSPAGVVVLAPFAVDRSAAPLQSWGTRGVSPAGTL